MNFRIGWTVLLIVVGNLAHGQGFNQRYDAFGWGFPQGAFGLERTPSGFTVIGGSSDCDSISPEECFFHGSVLLTFIDNDGTKLSEQRAWRPLHSAFAGWANCCDTIPGGGYIVGGASEATDGTDEVYLMRFDANGDTLWTRVFGDPALNRFWIGQQVKRTLDGGFIIVGSTDQQNTTWGFAIRTDANGDEMWTSIYPWAGANSGGFISCAIDPGGDLFMGGTRNFSNTDNDHWLQRTDPNGNLLWRTSWGGPSDEGATQIVLLNDGHILNVSGRGYEPNGEAIRPYLAKLDPSDGSIVWEQEYGPIAYSTTLFAGKETSTGDLIACGVTYAEEGQKGLLLRTNSEGDSLWMRSYYYQDEVISNGQGRFYDVLPADDGGFIAAGAAYNPVGGPNPPGYSQDTWVVKVDGDGCIVPGCDGVGITEQATNLLDAIRVFPNPAQSGQAVTVQLDLPQHLQGKKLELTVVASDGRLVQRQLLPSDSRAVPLSLGEGLGVRPGLYYLHLTNGITWLTGGKLVVE